MRALFVLSGYFEQKSVWVFRVLDNVQFSLFLKMNSSHLYYCIVTRPGNKIHAMKKMHLNELNWISDSVQRH